MRVVVGALLAALSQQPDMRAEVKKYRKDIIGVLRQFIYSIPCSARGTLCSREVPVCRSDALVNGHFDIKGL